MSDSCCGPTPIAIEQITAPQQATSGQWDDLPVVVIGAGPVGLAAAAHLAERGLDFLLLEAGDRVASSVAQWGHVRVFSPYRYNIDAAARRLLEADGWTAPDSDFADRR
ncbi:FAD-dependent oxidoreductase [Nonomuraea bangladeshensis]|uniref:FAD-dependent oxidoreductase n=1 Tax=Nonomuraea bangladeshensis TaxID=404385 RepID=UPI0031DF3438